jgi:hypothetical protein
MGNEFGKRLVGTGSEGGSGPIAEVGDRKLVFGTLVLDDSVGDTKAGVDTTRKVSRILEKRGAWLTCWGKRSG